MSSSSQVVQQKQDVDRDSRRIHSNTPTAGTTGGSANASASSSTAATSPSAVSPTSSTTTSPNETTAAQQDATGQNQSRRRFDRLSGGLRELGFEVLSRIPRHERDKSTSSSKSGPVGRSAIFNLCSDLVSADTQYLSSTRQKSPDVAKTSPPQSRSSMSDASMADLRSPESINSANSAMTSTETSRRPTAAFNRPAGSISSTSSSSRKTFVLVTQDHDNLSKVDLSGLGSPAAVRERLYAKSHIPDDDFKHCSVHLSSLDQAEPGSALSDGELWQICQSVQRGEVSPTPLFYIQVAVSSSVISNYGTPSPDLPSSPYNVNPPHISSYDQFVRPESLQESSSNSSGGRRYPNRHHSNDQLSLYPNARMNSQREWERRSSAGNSDYEQPEWLERSSQIHRGDRQMRSEAPVTFQRGQWDPHGHPQGGYVPLRDTRPTVTIQPVGMGPSGPIFRPDSAHSNRPRANSSTVADPSFPSQRTKVPPMLGPSGPLHFPQPIHHGQPAPIQPPQKTNNLPLRQQFPPQQTIYEQQPYLPNHNGPRLDPPQMRRNAARSMDNLRNGPGSVQRPSVSPPLALRSPQQISDPRFPPFDPERPASQPGPSRGALSPYQQAHPPHAAMRIPPSNTSPRIMSHPPYSPQMPTPQSAIMPDSHQPYPPKTSRQSMSNNNARPQPHLIQAYARGGPHESRPSSDYIQRQSNMPTALQSAAGPQRLALHPGETLQEVMHNQRSKARQATSPQLVPSPHERFEHSRGVSYEDRPYQGYQGGIYESQSNVHQFPDAQFTSSPPANFSEQAPTFFDGRNNNERYMAGSRESSQTRSTQSPPTAQTPRSANRSSSSSVERTQRSPTSSRVSTSSGGPFADSQVERPPSSSSASSSKEVQTSASERKSAALPAKAISPSHKLTGRSNTSHITNTDDVYEGVELLRDSIDAATDPRDGSRPSSARSGEQSGSYDSFDGAADEVKKAKEWAHSYVGVGASDVQDDDDTLGKNKQAKKALKVANEDDDEESSTLGKTSKPKDNMTSRTIEPKEAPKVSLEPKFTYDPDEDDDDDVATWAVQMKPTKAKTEPATEITASLQPPLSDRAGDEPESVSTTSSDDQTATRHIKPSLRVQTNVHSSPNSPNNVTLPVTSGQVSHTDKVESSPKSAAKRGRHSASNSGSGQDEKSLPSKTHDAAEGGNAVNRRASFGNNAWAYRPPVEQVYENLEEFFPGHDLDKPIVDAGVLGPNSGMPSPATENVPFSSAAPSPPAAVPAETPSVQPVAPSKTVKDEGGRRFNQNRKSMRMVAQDRKSRLKREETAAKANAVTSSLTSKDESKISRRKSTKVWGRKIEEITSAEADRLNSAKTDSPSTGRDELAPINWVKGELIGKGTYGHVYIGFNITNGEMIAVKQVEVPRTASDKDDNRQLSVVEALKSEVELLKDLEHEKIVSYLGFQESPRYLSLLMEYVPGGSVGRCLRKHGKFTEEVIQFFTTQILEGLEYLHQRGILHRDLKADNILVKMDGTIKISDFGISKRSNDIYNNNSNMSMQGSIFWMAPEVVHNQKKGYSAKIDIWSLGCVVLEMFAGRRPWDSEEAIQAMFKLGAERLAPPVPKDVVLSNQSSHFLKECFHGDPDKRPTASRLLCHKFLTLDKNWDFHMSSLYKAMSA